MQRFYNWLDTYLFPKITIFWAHPWNILLTILLFIPLDDRGLTLEDRHYPLQVLLHCDHLAFVSALASAQNSNH
jgi:hypothetical protein